MRDHDPQNASFDADDTTDHEDRRAGARESADGTTRPRSSRRIALGCAQDVHDRPTLVP
ncbi:MAG: hypothetical protein KIS78_25750 [Labilithrix sp.]|nr:hypothetical protein [Labilithrix sp.]